MEHGLTTAQGLFWAGAFALGAVVYCIPALVARVRDHQNMTAIVVLNLLLGWTLLGWVVALVWACMAQPEPAAGAPVAFREMPAPGGAGGYEPPRSGRSAAPAAVHRWGAVITGLLVIVGIMLGLALR